MAVEHGHQGGNKRANALKASAIIPQKGSSAEAVMRQAKDEYAIKSYVIPDHVWKLHGMGDDLVKSYNGEIYMSDQVNQDDRAIAVPHESTHIMWQTGFAPYMQFRNGTGDYIDFTTPTGRILVSMAWDHISKSNGLEDLITVLESEDPKATKIRNRLYDEINATTFGYYVNGITSGTLKDGSTMDFRKAFHNFDAYAKELQDIHEQFKRSRGGEKTPDSDQDIKAGST